MQTKTSRKGKRDMVTNERQQLSEDFFRQWDLAEVRMGRTPAQRLAWVVEFSQKDLETLRPGERTALGYDLRMLYQLGWAPAREMKAAGGYGHMVSPGIEAAPMPEAQLRRLQAEIAAGLQGLVSGRAWDVPPPQGLFIARMSPAGAKKVQFQIQWQGDEHAAILNGVVNLLLVAGETLRACAECERPLLARKRQIYCSPACSQKVRDRNRPPRLSRAKA
jgi:hypothetical protein